MSLCPAPAGSTALEQAHAIAACGLRVLPIRPGQKHPPMASWQHAATTDPVMIEKWWNGLYRDHGVGIAMGPQPDGRWVFAVDIDEHDPAASGSDTIAELQRLHGELPDTVRSITGSGGAHHLFTAGDVAVTNGAAGQVGPGIDIRGAGGQIVVAPTTHPNGTNYEWEASCAPWEIEIAPAPGWLLELVKPPPPVQPSVAPVEPFARATDDDSPADHLRAMWDWYTELTKRGWQVGRRTDPDGSTQWTRPGKDPREGASAVLHGPDGPFVVFTTDASVAPMWRAGKIGNGVVTLSPLAYLAAYDHAGDLSAATRAVRQQMGPTVTVLANVVDPTADPDADLRALLVDWPEFWKVDHNAVDWLMEPVIASGRSHALFAPGGTGKSLLALWLAATAAIGHQGLTKHAQPATVLYLDYEMTADDLSERLESMGYGADSDLSRLHYALLPSLPGLDEPEGGKAVVRLAEIVGADLVVIDTFGRAVHGDENDADTVRSWYRWTGLHLKAAGRAFVRVDHAGKDLDKGQRGTSAKNDDVDVVWQMTRQEGETFVLKARKRRMGWVPEKVTLERIDAPHLHYKLHADDATYPEGTKAVADALDELDVPIEASRRVAVEALQTAGRGARTALVTAAQRWRRQALPPFMDGPKAVGNQGGNQGSGAEAEPVPEPLTTESSSPQLDGTGNQSGNQPEPPPDVDGNHGSPLLGDPVPNVPSPPAFDIFN